MPTPRVVRFTLLAFALIVGFALRAASLNTYGFSEDETAKLRAVDAYRHGAFSANAEHPMLMKLAIWSALDLADAAGRAGIRITPEAALRAPNVLAGTASIAVVGAAAALLFSPWIGALAALLVAFDPNVIAIHRIGKEDTFLVFFFFVAVWCYERAKRIGEHDLAAARPWYTAAGGAFGLMLASKYMPHLLGLFALFNIIHKREAGPNCPDKPRYYAAMAAAFVAANFAILLPSTWSYCLTYLQGRHLAHHGFQFAGHLYVTNVPLSTAGVPATYYLRMIFTKVPVAVLAAAAVGVVPLVRNRGDRGFVWLRVLLVCLLIGYSAAAAKFQRYGLPLLILIDILAAVGVATVVEYVMALRVRPMLRNAAAGTLYAAAAMAPLLASAAVRPFYSLHQNVLGARLAPPATVFPEEAYDYGVREAVAEIARRASADAAIISDAPGVVSHYAAMAGRPDLQVLSLSQAGVNRPGEQWVIVQDGHLSFENAASVAQLRSTTAWLRYRLWNTPVLELYHLNAEPAIAGRRPPSRRAPSSPAGSS
jgi:4-amino-4-deoxy-L-arabinose transferase-like glycosyltransferase